MREGAAYVGGEYRDRRCTGNIAREGSKVQRAGKVTAWILAFLTMDSSFYTPHFVGKLHTLETLLSNRERIYHIIIVLLISHPSHQLV